MFFRIGDKRAAPPPSHAVQQDCSRTIIRKGSLDFKNGFLNNTCNTFFSHREWLSKVQLAILLHIKESFIHQKDSMGQAKSKDRNFKDQK